MIFAPWFLMASALACALASIPRLPIRAASRRDYWTGALYGAGVAFFLSIWIGVLLPWRAPHGP